MKNKTKGFTLIELLATIVILAIIALITTPTVLNLIENARKGAFARSAEGVLSASKLYYSSSLLENITPGTINFKCNNKECITDFPYLSILYVKFVNLYIFLFFNILFIFFYKEIICHTC